MSNNTAKPRRRRKQGQAGVVQKGGPYSTLLAAACRFAFGVGLYVLAEGSIWVATYDPGSRVLKVDGRRVACDNYRHALGLIATQDRP